ncbi:MULTISPECIES: FkbM family methyltransferase [Halopseudomonas]|uniref:Methyltransferase, FkbM family n=1 Tax=Halopseudomonas bauzanensis TaxID=653930 RepID=A0A1I4MR08_9GAMM|nr:MULTISPECIES: FkbM family methyltransferase [Halopseudomonas]SES04758.1 methyltransferase, FkbM family [Halopseudomonas bauzanensis]SFM05443.1 methyltransferase, FkbM family [Halopseudomonas bauzanensis]
MIKQLVEDWRIQERRQIVSQRGLNVWPKDQPDDLEQIERIGTWLDSLGEPEVLEHPLRPLKMQVAKGGSARMAYYFAMGDYEEADLELIEKLVMPGDRVLECGGGAGITGSLAAIHSGNPVTIVEPNEVMHDIIRQNVRLNGHECQLIAAAVVADDFSGEMLTLRVQDEYWWSSVLDHGSGEPVETEVARISDLLESIRPSVLVLDIEGAEVGLLPHKLPDDLRLIMVELHTPEIGDVATVSVVNTIMGQGFRLCHVRSQTWVFERSV